MKIILMTWMLVCASAPAWANVESGVGEGSTKAEACQRAKSAAEAKCNAFNYIGVEHYHRCDCSDSHSDDDTTRWNCSVDANCAEPDPRPPLDLSAVLLQPSMASGH